MQGISAVTFSHQRFYPRHNLGTNLRLGAVSLRVEEYEVQIGGRSLSDCSLIVPGTIISRLRRGAWRS